MNRLCVTLTCLLWLTSTVWAQKPLDGSSAARWEPRTGWTPSAPTVHEVADGNGTIVFRAEGAGNELPWQISLTDDEIVSEARYLVVRYRAEGVSNQPGNYFIHGWEGTTGGRRYAGTEEIRPDGAAHVLAVDLLEVQAQADTAQVAVKVIVDDTGTARLTIERMWFTDDLPADAEVAAVLAKEPQSTTFDWAAMGEPQPAPGWTLDPATEFGATLDGEAMTFTVRGAGKQMRWPVTLPEPVDLASMSHVSLRYKASGALGQQTYTVHLGDQVSGEGGHAVIALHANSLVADGQWHTAEVEIKQAFTATQINFGLDCDGEVAEMALGAISFSSEPARWPVAAALPHETRLDAWPDGRDGWTVLRETATGDPSPFLGLRLGLSDWFASESVMVYGVPFAVPAAPDQAPQTGTSLVGASELPLPASATEVYVLTATTAPPTEPWGLDSQHPRPVEMLSEPEKVVFEVRYANGPSDYALPLDLPTRQWGMKRGLGVCVLHADPSREPVALVLHDQMQTASFSMLGVTVRTDAPRVAAPSWQGLSYPTPPEGALGRLDDAEPMPHGARVVKSGKLAMQFAGGPTPDLIGLGPAVRCGRGPVFEVEIGDTTLPAESWELVDTADFQGGSRFVLRHSDTGLSATLDCLPSDRSNALTLHLSITNESEEPLTATVRFPVLNGITLGPVDDTWYLSGKRGGIINREPLQSRDPLGETHPLQVDGFFNPHTGIALACLTHDTVGQHHFIRLAKDADGGAWAPEYVKRDLAAGSTFTATEAELVLREGDWRAIFDAYREWLGTWYVAPTRKPWWERTFAFIGRNAQHESVADPLERGAIQSAIDDAIQYLGLCDYVHLYGWSASPTHGEWGDYDHYDETVGGIEYFRANIDQAQNDGVAVGLYQDGYLSSEAGETVGSRAREWALIRENGSPDYVEAFGAYNQCPYIDGWREHLVSTYARIRRDTGAKGLYVDEYGATDGRWICYSKDHGHNSYEIPYAGEVEVLSLLREAVGPDTALYTEYPPAEASRLYLDGSFTYQALWSADQEHLAPHFIDLQRFAFPHFKQFHIMHYVACRSGNWWLLKFPFFNGESYDIGQPNLPGFDEAALAFQRRAVEVLCAHREAFSSDEVAPLVETEAAGVFANRFTAPNETIWTLYNANGRSVRGPVLKVPHRPDATYEDAWSGAPLDPEIIDGWAIIDLDLGPKAVGCIVQRMPGGSRV